MRAIYVLKELGMEYIAPSSDDSRQRVSVEVTSDNIVRLKAFVRGLKIPMSYRVDR